MTALNPAVIEKQGTRVYDIALDESRNLVFTADNINGTRCWSHTAGATITPISTVKRANAGERRVAADTIDKVVITCGGGDGSDAGRYYGSVYTESGGLTRIGTGLYDSIWPINGLAIDVARNVYFDQKENSCWIKTYTAAGAIYYPSGLATYYHNWGSGGIRGVWADTNIKIVFSVNYALGVLPISYDVQNLYDGSIWRDYGVITGVGTIAYPLVTPYEYCWGDATKRLLFVTTYNGVAAFSYNASGVLTYIGLTALGSSMANAMIDGYSDHSIIAVSGAGRIEFFEYTGGGVLTSVGVLTTTANPETVALGNSIGWYSDPVDGLTSFSYYYFVTTRRPKLMSIIRG